jgi:hypothetical protein
MQNESLKDFNEALDEYGVSLDQFKSDDWKLAVVSHAQGNKNFVYLALFHSVTHNLNNTRHWNENLPCFITNSYS